MFLFCFCFQKDLITPATATSGMRNILDVAHEMRYSMSKNFWTKYFINGPYRREMRQNNVDRMANSEDPDQMVSLGAA